jgi:transcriptional regulator with XRE-family HTH domain
MTHRLRRSVRGAYLVTEEVKGFCRVKNGSSVALRAVGISYISVPSKLCYVTITSMTSPRIARQLTQLGATLRNARIEAGLTQDELGQRAGVTRQLVSRVESGNPRGEVGRVAQVADALGYRLTVAPRTPPKPTQDRQAVRAYLDRLNRPYIGSLGVAGEDIEGDD